MTPRTIVVPIQLKRHLILTTDNIANQTLAVLLTDAYNAIRGHEYTKAVALYKKCIMNVLQECIDEEKKPEMSVFKYFALIQSSMAAVKPRAPDGNKRSHFVNLPFDGRQSTMHLMPKHHIYFLLDRVSKPMVCFS